MNGHVLRHANVRDKILAHYDVYVDTETGNIYLLRKGARSDEAIPTNINRDGGPWKQPKPKNAC